MNASLRRLVLTASAVPLVLAGQATFAGALAASSNGSEVCKNGGWQNAGQFKNQGDCVSYYATGAAAAEAAKPPTFSSASAPGGSPSAAVTMSEPVLCASVDGADFQIVWAGGGHPTYVAVVTDCDGDSDDTFTVSYVSGYGYHYQSWMGTFSIHDGGQQRLRPDRERAAGG